MQFACKFVLLFTWRHLALGAPSVGLEDQRLDGGDATDGLASSDTDTSGIEWVDQTLDGLDGEIVPLGPRTRFIEAPPEDASLDDDSTEYTMHASAEGDSSAPLSYQRGSSSTMTPPAEWEEMDLAYDLDERERYDATEDPSGYRYSRDSHADYGSSSSGHGSVYVRDGSGTTDEGASKAASGNGILPTARWGRLRGRLVMTEDKKRVFGIGEETYEDGSRYEGSLVRGQRHGSGRLCYSEVTEGEWSDGQETEACYEGQWANGMRNGYGRFESAAFSYVGRWSNDAPNDPMNGRMWFPIQGAAYTGGVVEGMPDGHGVMEHDGEGQSSSKQEGGGGLGSSGLGGGRYEGNFHRGLKHGHGTFVRAAGGENDHSSRWAYVGDWRLDHRHGLGQMASGDAVRAIVPTGWPLDEEQKDERASDAAADETDYIFNDSNRSDNFSSTWNSSNINVDEKMGDHSNSSQGRSERSKASNSPSHSTNDIGAVRGTLYQGEWIEGVRHGRGQLADYWRGSLFIGRFEQDQPTGKGVLRLLCSAKAEESAESGTRLACEHRGSPLIYDDEEDEISTLGFDKSDGGGALLYRGEWVRGLRNGFGAGLWRGSGVGGLVWSTISWAHAKGSNNGKYDNQAKMRTASAAKFEKSYTDLLSRSLHSDDGVRKQRWQARAEEAQITQESGNNLWPVDYPDNSSFVDKESGSSPEMSSENFGSGPGGARSGGAWWWYDGDWSNDRPEGQGTAHVLFPATSAISASSAASTTPTPIIPTTPEATSETLDSDLPPTWLVHGPNDGSAAWVYGGASCRGGFMGGLVHGTNVTCTVKGPAAKQASNREPLPWQVPKSTLCPSASTDSTRDNGASESSLNSVSSDNRSDRSSDDNNGEGGDDGEMWMMAILERYEGTMRHGVRDGTGEHLIEYQTLVNCSHSAHEGPDKSSSSKSENKKRSARSGSDPELIDNANASVEIEVTTAVSVSRTYRGAFKNGVFHGKGSLTTVITVQSSGRKEGRNGALEQPILKQQARYVGNFANGFHHGAGREARPDGSSHEGEFRNGHPHGFGRVQFKNGDSESGVYVNGLRDGRHLFERAANPQSASLPKRSGSTTSASSTGKSTASTPGEALQTSESSESGATLFLQRYRLGTLLGASTDADSNVVAKEEEKAAAVRDTKNDDTTSQDNDRARNQRHEDTGAKGNTAQDDLLDLDSKATGIATSGRASDESPVVPLPEPPEGAVPVASNLRAKSSRGSRVL